MRCHDSIRLLIALVVLAAPGAADAADPGPAEVVVLSTLHQYHDEIDGYSFEALGKIIEALEPDVLAVELTPNDLASRREQNTKQEYQLSVFPLLDRHDYKTVPLEPAPPLFDELVGMFREAHGALAENAPDKVDVWGLYVESLYDSLFEYWDSAQAVNSPTTDALFEAKHRFQAALFGPLEAEVWERWNEHFNG